MNRALPDERAAAWAELLDRSRPPHPPNDWLTPLRWPLVQATYANTVLRGRYPAISLNILVLADDPDWWRSPTTVLPGIAIGSAGWYSVVSGRLDDLAVLFESREPAAVVRRLAGLLADDAAT